MLQALTDGAHGAQIVDGGRRYELVMRLPDDKRGPGSVAHADRYAVGATRWYPSPAWRRPMDPIRSTAKTAAASCSTPEHRRPRHKGVIAAIRDARGRDADAAGHV